MSITVNTLADFFGPASPRAAGALEKRAALASTRALPAAMRGDAAECLVETGRTLLDCPLADIFADAWLTRRDLKRLRDGPGGKLHAYPLLKHEIALKRTPEVELTVNGAPCGLKIPFELKLALNVSGAELRIQDGAIVGGRLGEFRGQGSFSCADVTLFERKSASFRLPGDFTLARPLPLP